MTQEGKTSVKQVSKGHGEPKKKCQTEKAKTTTGRWKNQAITTETETETERTLFDTLGIYY
jgi:hypothetical protein